MKFAIGYHYSYVNNFSSSHVLQCFMGLGLMVKTEFILLVRITKLVNFLDRYFLFLGLGPVNNDKRGYFLWPMEV